MKINIDNNKDYLNIDTGNYRGDLRQAQQAIPTFCDAHKIAFNSFGHGYGELVVDDKKHDINPYGIDIEMMLKFCNIQLNADANETPTPARRRP